ncbi:MAG: hypothetical protein JOZ73_12020 [Solirubrobacterales bacterium]|nr:hypothetical protein [Solirubrobacterales bacterium]
MAVAALFKNDSKNATQGLVYYDGSFQIGAAGAVVAGSIKGGRIASAARTGTGTYLVTLRDGGFPECINKFASIETAGTGAWAGEGAVTLGSGTAGATFTIYTYNAAGTATDLTTGIVSFEIGMHLSLVK